MKWWNSQLGNIEQIISSYSGKEAFHLYLKAPLKNLRAGSKDRRNIRNYAYNYLRMARFFGPENLRENIIAANALLTPEYNAQLHFYIESHPDKELFDTLESLSVSERFRHYAKLKSLDSTAIFPAFESLSSKLDADKFINKLLSPKDVFIWCKRGSKHKVQSILAKANLPHSEVEGLDDALRLPPGAKLSHALGRNDYMVEVQDISSQRALAHLKVDHDATVWDCCAGSGGKSLHLANRENGPIWLLSDKRESMMPNLKRRFKTVSKYFAYATHDLITSKDEFIVFNTLDGHIQEIGKNTVDMVIADVPCTGSGTWSRNPEHLKDFDDNKIGAFAKVQGGIMDAAWKFVRKGGKLAYMTCSAYEAENEAQVERFMAEKGSVHLDSMQYFGENEEGDLLFQAILTKLQD